MSEATLKKIKALLENDQIQEALAVINKALKPTLDDEGLKWWNILWDGFPSSSGMGRLVLTLVRNCVWNALPSASISMVPPENRLSGR